jgi:4-diphosphocytidyl-2-C-methyl-D-erythritol kinase
MASPASVTVRAPAKVNLELVVGRPGDDGYHPLATVFQAVSLHDLVTLSPAPSGTIEVRVTAADPRDAIAVPSGPQNLAVRAAMLMTARVEAEGGSVPGVRIEILKEIPVAGGMAGASADAAATLLAVDHLWDLGLTRDELVTAAAALGSDVPFCLVGGTAIGTGRGERLTPALTDGTWHWVLLVADGGLSTPGVYAELDRLRRSRAVPPPRVSDALMAALRGGDPWRLGRALRNDLQAAAIALRPALGDLLDQVRVHQVPGVLVSGSGPTVAVLAEDPEHADRLAEDLADLPGVRRVVRAHGPVPGCQVIDDPRPRPWRTSST